MLLQVSSTGSVAGIDACTLWSFVYSLLMKKWSWKWWFYQLNMVILHSYVNVYQRVPLRIDNLTDSMSLSTPDLE